MKFLLIVLLLLSCATTTMGSGYIDPAFQVYVQEFIDNSEGKITIEDIDKISITFKDYEKDKESFITIVGTCHFSVFKGNYIVINREWWEKLEDPYYHIEKAAVIWHELGHCVLYRGHTASDKNLTWWEKCLEFVGLRESEKTLPDGCPISLMNPYTLDSWCWDDHYNYYVKELYNPSLSK